MIAPPTPEYLDQLRHTHEAHLRVTLFSAGVEIGELPVSSVRLTIDGTAEIWRTAEISVGIDFWETETREWLEQANIQSGAVKIEHGIKWAPADVVHWIQIAYLRIDQLNMSLLSAGRQITAYDRALLLQEHQLPTARPLDAAYTALITTMLQETLPGETLTLGPGISTTLAPAPGKSLDLSADRLSEIHHLAQAVEGTFHNTPTGGFHISKVDEDADPVWDINAGTDGVLVNLTQDFARAEQYNAVGIEFSPDAGTDDDWMVYIYAWDNEPTSPTFYDGPFGKRNIFFQEEYDHLPSDDDAEALARRKLAEYTGATRGLHIQCVYNPLLQPGDHISVDFPDLGTVEEHVIESITVSLGESAAMDIETRLKRDAADIRVSKNAGPETVPLVMPELIPPEQRKVTV